MFMRGYNFLAKKNNLHLEPQTSPTLIVFGRASTWYLLSTFERKHCPKNISRLLCARKFCTRAKILKASKVFFVRDIRNLLLRSEQ
jgi:hypothetical protein